MYLNTIKASWNITGYTAAGTTYYNDPLSLSHVEPRIDGTGFQKRVSVGASSSVEGGSQTKRFVTVSWNQQRNGSSEVAWWDEYPLGGLTRVLTSIYSQGTDFYLNVGGEPVYWYPRTTAKVLNGESSFYFTPVPQDVILTYDATAYNAEIANIKIEYSLEFKGIPFATDESDTYPKPNGRKAWTDSDGYGHVEENTYPSAGSMSVDTGFSLFPKECSTTCFAHHRITQPVEYVPGIIAILVGGGFRDGYF